jgi:hypothetical protein
MSLGEDPTTFSLTGVDLYTFSQLWAMAVQANDYGEAADTNTRLNGSKHVITVYSNRTAELTDKFMAEFEVAKPIVQKALRWMCGVRLEYFQIRTTM